MAFASRMITFMAGKQPWAKYDDRGTAFVLADDKIGEVAYDEYDGRKKIIWEIIEEVGGDKLAAVLFGYMASAH